MFSGEWRLMFGFYGLSYRSVLLVKLFDFAWGNYEFLLCIVQKHDTCSCHMHPLYLKPPVRCAMDTRTSMQLSAVHMPCLMEHHTGLWNNLDLPRFFHVGSPRLPVAENVNMIETCSLQKSLQRFLTFSSILCVLKCGICSSFLTTSVWRLNRAHGSVIVHFLDFSRK